MILLFSIITEISLWFFPLCILSGAAGAFILYRKDKKFAEAPKSVRYTMASLRGIVLCLLLFLLLSPFIEFINQEIQKPIIVVAADNSESILLNKDSAFYRNEYPARLQQMIERFGEKYDVAPFLFGQETKAGSDLDFSAKNTNAQNLADAINTKFFNRNVGAILLATDAINTEGVNFYYAFKELSTDAPVYSLALGDSLAPTDLMIQNITCNDVAYLGTKFPIEVSIKADFLEGKEYTLTIGDNTGILDSETFNIKSNTDFLKHTFYIEPKEPGTRQYTVSLSQLDGEITYTNNSGIVIVEVLKSKKKVLLLYNAPHPDIAALRNAVEMNANYEVDVMRPDELKGNIADYNLVIFHQLPSAKFSVKQVTSDVRKHEIPVLYIIGQGTNIPQYSKLMPDNAIVKKSSNFDEVSNVVNKDFALFDLDDETVSFLEKVPPLYAPFGNYDLRGDAKILAWQKLGSTTTNRPQFTFREEKGLRSGVIYGEGIWRWRINCFRKYKSPALFDTFINKIVTYLSLKDRKKQFSVKSEKIFYENQDVSFYAELYNDAQELNNDVDVTLTVTDSLGNNYENVFDKTNNAYYLHMGALPTGEYSYSAQTTIGDKLLQAEGMFRVLEVTVESGDITAHHNELYAISNATGGKVFYPDETDAMIDEILNDDSIVSVSYSNKELTELVDIHWLLVLLLLLLSAEWFLRKFFAGY